MKPNEQDIASGVEVVEAEARALDKLAASLDDSFGRAIDTLFAITGRTVITGMGKSGHVGSKIAATLASTGTPAHFVHPAECSHGDLGMITSSDAVLALSNSGNTAELTDLITYTRRYSVPLVSITSNANSALATAADVSLLLPAVDEACPLGLAPTTSTTMTLALGDALAVALYKRRDFTASDFQKFHPGGSLGQQLLHVRDLHHTDMPLVKPGELMADIIVLMTSKSFGCVGVVGEAGELLGVITDGDLRRHMADGFLAMDAASVMTASAKTIGPDALAAEAINVMNQLKITSLFVVSDNKPIGIVHIHDCLRAGLT
jgi:arabinose-5-phosphate isomerase